MIRKDISSAGILRDIEEVYALAMEKGNFTAALRAKELLGRECGLFSVSKKKRFSLADLSEEDLNRLIQELEAQIKCES
ncbi:MAG: hypothetical protein HYX35_01480 [Proteobacteria bacterium]|nr:hypothetical protein [Pseudomonadota bacterium]